MQEELVIIGTFYDVSRAYLIKAKLEAEGIVTFLRDEHINSILPGSSSGGIKVAVALQDSLRAYDIVDDFLGNDKPMQL